METKNYYDVMPEHLNADVQATGELKTFSKEIESSDRRQAVTLKAGEEYSKRVRRCMLYTNRSYDDASRFVADQDNELMQLYIFGEIIRE